MRRLLYRALYSSFVWKSLWWRMFVESPIEIVSFLILFINTSIVCAAVCAPPQLARNKMLPIYVCAPDFRLFPLFTLCPNLTSPIPTFSLPLPQYFLTFPSSRPSWSQQTIEKTLGLLGNRSRDKKLKINWYRYTTYTCGRVDVRTVRAIYRMYGRCSWWVAESVGFMFEIWFEGSAWYSCDERLSG